MSSNRGAGPAPSERVVLFTAAVAAMLLPLNSTMIAVAIPDIVRDHPGEARSTAWLVSGYLVVMASLLPSAGKLGDRFGRRRLILLGLAWFFAASLGAALAPDLWILIAFRLQQAVAGAVVFPNALAVVREALPAHRRGAGYGTVGSAIALAAAAGPPLGGALVALGGWRAIFLLNLPWVAAAIVLTLRAVPPALGDSREGRFDAVGAVGLTAVLAGSAWLLNPGRAPTWSVVAGGVAVLLALLTLLRYELAHSDPVLQPRFLGVRAFAAATVAIGLGNVALYGTLLALPLLLAHRDGWSSGKIGLALAALTVPMVALSPLGGRMADRLGHRVTALSGLAILAAAMLPLAIAGHRAGVPLLVCSMLGAGAGVGLSTPPLQTAGIEALDARHAGVASGLLSAGRYLGGIVAASLVAASFTDQGGGDYTTLFSFATGAAALAAVLSMALPGRSQLVVAAAR